MVLVTELPEDVQLHVLHFLDGCSLARCQRVCLLWYNIIDQWTDAWLYRILTEILSFVRWFVFNHHWHLHAFEYNHKWGRLCLLENSCDDVKSLKEIAPAVCTCGFLAADIEEHSSHDLVNAAKSDISATCKCRQQTFFHGCYTCSHGELTNNNRHQLWKKVYSTWHRSKFLSSMMKFRKHLKMKTLVTSVRVIG